MVIIPQFTKEMHPRAAFSVAVLIVWYEKNLADDLKKKN